MPRRKVGEGKFSRVALEDYVFFRYGLLYDLHQLFLLVSHFLPPNTLEHYKIQQPLYYMGVLNFLYQLDPVNFTQFAMKLY